MHEVGAGTTSQKRRLTHLWVCRSLIFFTTNLRYSLNKPIGASPRRDYA